MEKKYKFLISFFVAVMLISLAGFYSSYWSKFPRFSEFQNLVHVHFVAFSFWLFLIVIQPILIIRKKYKLHRRLGKFSYVLAPILVFTIILLSLGKFLREFSVDENAAAMTAFIAFVDISSFSTFYLVSVLKKSNLRWHVAFIIAATLIVLNPGLSRLLNQLNYGLGLLAAVLILFFFGSGNYFIDRKNKVQKTYFKKSLFCDNHNLDHRNSIVHHNPRHRVLEKSHQRTGLFFNVILLNFESWIYKIN